jgi:hypothetical protein
MVISTADGEDCGMPISTAKAPQPVRLPLVGQPIGADALDLDLCEGISCQHCPCRLENVVDIA